MILSIFNNKKKKHFADTIVYTASNGLKGECHNNFVLTETVGVRLGPTEMPEPLLSSVNCPFNFATIV